MPSAFRPRIVASAGPRKAPPLSVQSPSTPQPPFAGPVSVDELLADQPPVRQVGTGLDEIRAGRRLVVFDDDPTGTQSIADLPVLTSWSVDDVRWAL